MNHCRDSKFLVLLKQMNQELYKYKSCFVYINIYYVHNRENIQGRPYVLVPRMKSSESSHVTSIVMQQEEDIPTTILNINLGVRPTTPNLILRMKYYIIVIR